MSITRFCLHAVLSVVAASCAGCASKPKAPPPPPPTIDVLSMVVRTGGVHHRLAWHDGMWYQSFDSRVLVVDPVTGFAMHEVNLGRLGESPPIVDMLVHGDSLFVVLEAERIVRLSLAAPEKPAIVEPLETTLLGVAPFTLSVADGRLFCSGDGGVIDLDARTLVSTVDGRAGRVAMTAEGLATTVGRNVVRLNDGAPIGSATDLFAIPESFGLGDHLIGIRQRDTGALISMMTGEVREVQSQTSSIAVAGKVHAIRFFDDLMWVASTDAIHVCTVAAEGIAVERTINVLGARDVARRDDNHLIIAGVFGRAVYREKDDDDGPGDEFVAAQREPSGLPNAVTDRRYILAGGPMGFWRYLIGQPFAEFNDRSITQQQTPQRSAQTPTATAQLSPDGTTVQVEVGGTSWVHSEPAGVRMHCVYAIEGRFWVGHDRGITVLTPRPPAPAVIDPEQPAPPPPVEPKRVLGRLRFEGPVLFIYPLATGLGGVFVSEFGGFGVAEIRKQEIEPVPVPIPPKR